MYRIFFISREAYRNSTTRISKHLCPVENAVYEIVQVKNMNSRPLYMEQH